MTDEELITRLNNLFWLLEEEGYYTMASNVKFAAVSIKTKAAEIERLRGDLAKAQGALHQIAGKKDYADDPWCIARAALAELTGDKT